MFLRCRMDSLAQLLVDRCRQNSNGDYCNVASTYLADVNSAFTECVLSGGNCTTRCRNFLLMFRDEMGCCVNHEFNSTLSPVYNPSVFTSELWSSCNVQPITAQCTPSTVQLNQTQGASICSTSDLIQQNGMLVCNLTFIQPIIDRLTDGCEPYGQAVIEQCGYDESNQPCYLRALEVATAFANVVSVCQATDTSMCDSRCTSVLRSLADLGGCCINNFFNGSLAGIITPRYSWFSSQYWSVCGIDSPGFCDTSNETVFSIPTIAINPSTAATPTATIATTPSNGAVTLTTSITLIVIYSIVSFWIMAM